MLEHWKDHFHPHEGNEHAPHAYRAGGAIALALVIMSIVAFSGLQTTFVKQSDNFLAAVVPSVLVDLTNEDRADEGLSSLTPNEALQQAAQLKANHMAEYSYFAHDAPDGTTPWEWFARAGYEYDLAGENLAINFSDSADVAQAWMDSPTHRDNILKQGFTEIGIATAKGEYEGEETIFVVQMFARPSAANLAARDDAPLAVADPTSASSDDSGEGTGTTDEPEATEEAVEESEPAVESSASVSEPTPEPEPASQPAEETTEEPTIEDSEELEEEEVSAEPVAVSDFEQEVTPTPPNPGPEGEEVTLNTQVEGEAGISLLPFGSTIERQASQLSHLLSQPNFIFKTLMFTLFALISLVLLVSVGVEAKRHHVNHALKSLGALTVLMLVFFFGSIFFFPEPEVSAHSDSLLSARILDVGSIPSL